jgi:DNA-binding NarL/FixJ family response regulator
LGRLSPNPRLRLDLASGPIVVAILTRDPLVRAGLAAAIELRSDVVVVEDLAEANVALVDDVEMSDPPIPIVVLVADESAAAEAVNSGAEGVVLRTAEGSSLLAALVAVRHGLRVIDPVLARPSVAVRTLQPDGIDRLTTRELEVLDLVADGLSNKRVAARLEISEHTAKFHVNSILAKLGASSRTEAVVIAARRGFLIL